MANPIAPLAGIFDPGALAGVPHASRLMRWVGGRIRPLPLLLLLVHPHPAPAQRTLFAQSVRTALARGNPGLEYVVFDLRTHEVLTDTFQSPSAPIPAGSLLKPFLAMAYGQMHNGAFPTVVCHGHPDRCWKRGGHGSIALTEALAQSCNAYFLTLASGLSPVGVAAIPYLPAPPANSSPEMLIGLTPEWTIAPETLSQAYAALLAAAPTSTHAAILAGMRESADHGTAARIGPHPGGVLAKTGTAPCIDAICAANGDGLVIAAAPADHPTLLVLVRRRATNGATTAASAGRILTQLEALHAE